MQVKKIIHATDEIIHYNKSIFSKEKVKETSFYRKDRTHMRQELTKWEVLLWVTETLVQVPL